ncbi:MAG: AAA family ATPase [Anaerolineae bacterium]
MIAKKSSWRETMPAFLQYLENSLGYPVCLHEKEFQFDLYFVDLSAWKLRFSDRTPVIWVRPDDLAALDTRELIQSLTEVIRVRHLAERNSILLVQGSGEALQSHFRTLFVPILVLDQADQEAIRASRRPSGELLDRLSAQLDLSLLAPYETSKPVTGSRFYGREFEIRRILQSGNSNFALMGIRRIGKTSLMREVERRLREQVQDRAGQEAQERIIFMDCSAITSSQHFVQEVVRKLNPRELMRLGHQQFPVYFPDFLDRMSRRLGGPLIFLLDEFDQLLAWHYHDDTVLNALRASSNMGHCRYIVAGFREVLHAFTDLDSPLYNFAKPLRLKEFSRDQTADLVLGPLEKLRVHFERRNEVIDRIYDETAGQPNLVQFYCSILVEQLDRQGRRTLSPDSLFDVYGDEDFRAFVVSTFMDNTTHLEKAIVFAVMARYGLGRPFDLADIDRALQDQPLEVPLVDLDGACRNLELAGTFTQRGKQFRFATPVFPRILQDSYDVDFLFRKIIQEGVW